ncbi:MAG: peptidase S15, partial [Methylobacteriaceae bacterium]|nr:peptidase S15 [Methylobacteriaceae bacterium]
PSTTRTASAGRFVAEAAWPSPAIEDRILHLAPGRLDEARPEPGRLAIRSPLWTGSACGEWMGAGVEGEMPPDQRIDDALSLAFDTEPLAEDIDILGFPLAELDLSSDAPYGQIAVRLCDVAPDGASLRVSYAVLNLAHREGSAAPHPMTPNAPTRVRLALNACGHRFPAGHRLRLAVSTAYWPLVWPARAAATITLVTGASRLVLPQRRPRPDETSWPFPAPEHGPHAPQTLVCPGHVERRVAFDHIAATATYVTKGEGGVFGEGVLRFDDIGTTLSHDITRTLSIGAADPFSAQASVEQRYTMGREGWSILIETSTRMTGTADKLSLFGSLNVFENGTPVFARTWEEHLPREHL